MNSAEGLPRQTKWWMKALFFVVCIIAWKTVIWIANDGPTLANPFVPEQQTYYQTDANSYYGFPFNNFGARGSSVANPVESSQGWMYQNIITLNFVIVFLIVFGVPGIIMLRQKKLRRWMLVEFALSLLTISIYSVTISYIFSKIRVG